MPVAPLPIDDIVRVVVNLSGVSATRKAFDLCLIIGENTVIPKEERVRLFSSTTEMAQAGFKLEDRLYKAAELLFGQNKKPPRILVGTKGQDETPLQAMQACREANSDWYVGYLCVDMTAVQHEAVAEYINSVVPDSIYALTTSEDADVQKSDDSITVRLKNKKIRRAISQYSTKHRDAILGAIGYAMGSMNGLARSAYTLAFKSEVGVETENSTGVFGSQKLQNIKDSNCNVYVNRGGQYDGFESGVMADGVFFDEVIYLDKLKNDIQLGIMDALYNSPKIEGEESGVTKIINKITEVCDDFRRLGFIAQSGVWKGDPIMNLETGDALPNGYIIQSEPVDSQSQADRDARKSPPIYVSAKLSGAIHQVTIQVDVNR